MARKERSASLIGDVTALWNMMTGSTIIQSLGDIYLLKSNRKGKVDMGSVGGVGKRCRIKYEGGEGDMRELAL